MTGELLSGFHHRHCWTGRFHITNITYFKVSFLLGLLSSFKRNPALLSPHKLSLNPSDRCLRLLIEQALTFYEEFVTHQLSVAVTASFFRGQGAFWTLGLSWTRGSKVSKSFVKISQAITTTLQSIVSSPLLFLHFGLVPAHCLTATVQMPLHPLA